MAYVAGLDDIIAHNAFRVTLIRREESTYAGDRFIPGDKATRSIRAYFHPTGTITRTFIAAGEIHMHDITMWVSNEWLDRKGESIALQDMILYKSVYYEIISGQPLDIHNRFTQYVLRKHVGVVDSNPYVPEE